MFCLKHTFHEFPVNILQLNYHWAGVFLDASEFSWFLSSKLKCLMMTYWEREHWHWCVWIRMSSHLCLDCVTVNDDTAFLAPDILCTTHSSRPVAIHQLVRSSRHPSSTSAVCLSCTHIDTGHGGAQEVLSGWHIAWNLGRLHGYVWRMGPCIVFISSGHSYVFLHILTGNIWEQKKMLMLVNGLFQVWAERQSLAGCGYTLFILYVIFILTLKINLRISFLRVGLVCYWHSVGNSNWGKYK